eukprot:237417_1
MNKYVFAAEGITNNINANYPHVVETGPYQYQLRFIIIHSGALSGGHYNCLVIFPDKCFLFDDARVSCCDKNAWNKYFGGYNGWNAYILGYVQCTAVTNS